MTQEMLFWTCIKLGLVGVVCLAFAWLDKHIRGK